MEFFDLVDERGVPTGETASRSDAHRLGLRHRVAHVWVIRENDGNAQVLLQKRSRDKDSYPGLWDTSSAGHIPAGAEPLPSALRELEEELGIRAEARELKYIGQFHIQYEEIFHGAPFRDNEVSWVYVYDRPVDIAALRLQPEEVEAAAWFDLAEVRRGLRENDPRFCVPEDGLNVLIRYLKQEETT